MLESHASRGVFVAECRWVFSQEERARRLGHAAAHLCHEGILLGADLPEVRASLENAWKLLRKGSQTIPAAEEPKKVWFGARVFPLLAAQSVHPPSELAQRY